MKYEVNRDGELKDKQTEPIAGDGRDFWVRKRGLIKLIAGILRVDFADLWEREKKEAKKRWVIRAIFFLSLVGAIWFGYINYDENIEIKEHSQKYVVLVSEIEDLKNSLKSVTTDDEKIAIWKKIEKKKKELKRVEEVDKKLQRIEGAITKKAVEIYQTDC